MPVLRWGLSMWLRMHCDPGPHRTGAVDWALGPGWAWEAACGCFRMNHCTWYAELIPWSAWHRPGHAPGVWRAMQRPACLCPQAEVDRWVLTWGVT